MAEYAQQRYEELIPFVEAIQQLKLMDTDELAEIKTTMYEHEIAIQKTTRSLDDVLRFVEFLLDVLGTVRRRREALNEFRGKVEIEDKLQNRAKSLFGVYKRNFCDDLKFWLARLNFTIGQKLFDETSKVYRELTMNLGKKYPFLWQKASDFEWRRNPWKGIDAARRILQMGIREDNRSLDLYCMSFELELKYAEFLDDHQKNSNSKDFPQKHPDVDYEEEIMKCSNAAKVILNEAKNNCWGPNCTVNLYIRFHSVALKYRLFVDLQNQLLRDLESNCSSEEETYHVMAMLAFNASDFETGCKKLEKGLEVVHTVKMYELAVTALLSMAASSPSKSVFTTLHDILNRGHNNDKLSVKCYAIWAEMVPLWIHFTHQYEKLRKKMKKEPLGEILSTSEIKKNLDKGLQKYHHDPHLIVAMIKFLVATGELETAELFVLLGKLEERDKGERLHEELCTYLFMEFLTDPNRYNLVEDLVKMVKDPKAKEKLVTMYLRQLVQSDERGMEMARKFFKNTPNMTYKCSLCMAELEYLQSGTGKGSDKFRDIMERACQQFGKESIDPWVDYMRFERRMKNSNEASQIYKRAFANLPKHLIKAFLSAESEQKKSFDNFLKFKK